MINRRCRLCPCGVVSSYSSSDGLSNRRFDGSYREISAGGARCPLSKCRILFMAMRWTRDGCDTWSRRWLSRIIAGWSLLSIDPLAAANWLPVHNINKYKRRSLTILQNGTSMRNDFSMKSSFIPLNQQYTTWSLSLAVEDKQRL